MSWWTRSAWTPAALMMYRARNTPLGVVTAKPSSSRVMAVTGQLRWSSAPLRTAVSAMARAYSHGFTMAAEGASSASRTSPLSSGSRARASSPERRRRPATPFFSPRSSRVRRRARSSRLKARTRLPVFR